MPHDEATFAADGVEARVSSQIQIEKNKTQCPLCVSFAAALEAGMQTNEAFWDAIRLQMVRSLSLVQRSSGWASPP
jgi:hypothetical protein